MVAGVVGVQATGADIPRDGRDRGSNEIKRFSATTRHVGACRDMVARPNKACWAVCVVQLHLPLLP